ncbi:unnamed protein product [Paramecium octaurelia]|uniref:Uncharacterized protein n=1 Tax=Paramecium octaurelia TaxID=43137 RepID=A0A8S1XJY9_PAROT|nr:unnamed protein product [Paramecium octaurelia]
MTRSGFIVVVCKLAEFLKGRQLFMEGEVYYTSTIYDFFWFLKVALFPVVISKLKCKDDTQIKHELDDHGPCINE